MLVNFSKLNKGDVFIFQGDKAVKTHFHYITNGFRTFPTNARFINGTMIGHEIFFKHDTKVIKEDKL